MVVVFSGHLAGGDHYPYVHWWDSCIVFYWDTWELLFPGLTVYWKHLEAVPTLNYIVTRVAWPVWLQSLSNVIGPFVCSGSHVVQKDCHPSALSTFVDAVFQCAGPPSIPLKPCVVKYVGKSHNLWHRALLVLEQSAAETSPLFRPRSVVPAAAATAAAEYDFDAVSISPPVCKLARNCGTRVRVSRVSSNSRHGQSLETSLLFRHAALCQQRPPPLQQSTTLTLRPYHLRYVNWQD